MVVQHNITGQITRAVRMPGRFLVNGVWYDPGHVLVFVSAFVRKVVTPAEFDRCYTELPFEMAPAYRVVEERAWA